MPGPRAYVKLITIGNISIYSVTGDPNGVVAASLGSLASRDDSAGLYINTDGNMAWTQISGGSSSSGLILGVQPGNVSAYYTGAGDSFHVEGFFTDITPGYNAAAPVSDAGGVGNTLTSLGDGASSVYLNGASGDAAGTDVSIKTSQRPVYSHRFRIDGGLATSRLFVGFAPVDTEIASDSDDPAYNYFGLQFSPVSRVDTNFQIAGKSAGGGTQVLTDTGVVPAEGNIYRLEVEANSTTSWLVRLYLDGDGTSNFTSQLLYSATITNVNAIPVTTGYTFTIAMTEGAAATASFTHYFARVALRAGNQAALA